MWGVHRLCVQGGYQQVQALLHLPVLPRHRRWISRRIFLRQGHSGPSSSLMPYFGFGIYVRCAGLQRLRVLTRRTCPSGTSTTYISSSKESAQAELALHTFRPLKTIMCTQHVHRAAFVDPATCRAHALCALRELNKSPCCWR